jgi:hypothetical protein
MQMRETSTSEGGNDSLPPILPSEPQFPKTDGFFHMPQSWDIFYFPSEGRHTEDFLDARKDPTASAGFEPANLGSSGQYAN